jgi:hypothetical protein
MGPRRPASCHGGCHAHARFHESAHRGPAIHRPTRAHESGAHFFLWRRAGGVPLINVPVDFAGNFALTIKRTGNFVNSRGHRPFAREGIWHPRQVRSGLHPQPRSRSLGIAVVSAGRRKPRCRRATIAEAVCPQHRRSQPEATKLMAAATTQSVAITCAQIATIPKNSASEASVATSSTRVRPMSLTPILNAPFLADPWERLSFHSSRWQWKGSIARRTLGLSLTP